jgi:outer membrane protein OmpA-like peptidoglycan-associated protein
MSPPRTLSRWRIVATVTVTLFALIATGVACADEPVPAALPRAAGSTLPGKPLASRVAAPPALAQLQAQLDAWRAAGLADCEERYEAHRAQAWLNFAAYAAQNSAPPPVTAAALENAGESLTAASSMSARELPGVPHLRDDLWRDVAAIKKDGRVCGEPKMTAYCEVQLAWAGYEASDGGWRHVDPYVRIAEDYCRAASEAMRVPLAPRAVDSLPVDPESPAMVAIEAPEVEPESRIDVSLFVLFPHDRGARSDIRTPGRSALKRVAGLLQSLPGDVLVEIEGHADVTGGPGYNRALSERRARSVAQELTSQGVDAARIRLTAMGSERPVVRCQPSQERAAYRRYLRCLEPNRRVVLRLVDDSPSQPREAANAVR